MNDVPQMSPERPIILSPGRRGTGSRRRPVDIPLDDLLNIYFSSKKRTLAPLGDLHGTSPGRCVPAGKKLLAFPGKLPQLPTTSLQVLVFNKSFSKNE